MQRLWATMAAVICFSAAVAAQEPSANVPPPPNEGINSHVEGLTIPPLVGQPFSGRLVVRLTSQWLDGTTVRSEFFNVVARDSQGRVHQERRRIVPSGAGQVSRLTSVTIWDTPQRTKIVCELAERRCRLSWFRPVVQKWDEPEGLSRDGKSYLTRERMETTMLGDQEVEHTLETRTTNAGAEGNDKPLVSKREFWYQTELKINLAVKRSCSCGGTEELELTDLSRTEPDTALFEPPSGYTIVDLRKNRTVAQR